MDKPKIKITNDKKIIKYYPLLALFSDKNQINDLCRSFWGEEGNYSDEYYYTTLKQNLSYVYKEKNILIAACILRYDYNSGYVSIDILCVKKEYQRKGYGETLLKFCIDNCAKKNGLKYFELHVAQTNKKAINLYEKLKFYIVKPIENYYSNDKPPDNDAYLMQLNLNEIKEEKYDRIKYDKIEDKNKFEDMKTINFNKKDIIFYKKSDNNPNYNINNEIYDNYNKIYIKYKNNNIYNNINVNDHNNKVFGDNFYQNNNKINLYNNINVKGYNNKIFDDNFHKNNINNTIYNKVYNKNINNNIYKNIK